MTLNYFQNKGFSGRIAADVVNTVAVIAGLGLLFENHNPASYLLWWMVSYVAALSTLLTAAYLRVRFAQAGQSGLNLLFWVTLLVALCTFLAGLFALLARMAIAQLSILNWLPLLIVLIILVAAGYFMLAYFLMYDGRRVWGPLIFFTFSAGVLGITLATLGGLAGRVSVPLESGLRGAATVVAVLGLLCWQDAELLNLFSNPAWTQKLKSGAQCIGALCLLIAVILTTSAGLPPGWFGLGSAIAMLGTAIGIADGLRVQMGRRRVAGPVITV